MLLLVVDDNISKIAIVYPLGGGMTTEGKTSKVIVIE